MSSRINRLRKTGRYVKERDAKIKARGKTPSSTPGISKGANCQKHPLMIRLAKDARFYKTDPKAYASVSQMCRVRNNYK